MPFVLNGGSFWAVLQLYIVHKPREPIRVTTSVLCSYVSSFGYWFMMYCYVGIVQFPFCFYTLQTRIATTIDISSTRHQYPQNGVPSPPPLQCVHTVVFPTSYSILQSLLPLQSILWSITPQILVLSSISMQLYGIASGLKSLMRYWNALNLSPAYGMKITVTPSPLRIAN